MSQAFKMLIIALLITFSFFAVCQIAYAKEGSGNSIEEARTLDRDLKWFGKTCIELMRDIGHEIEKSALLRAAGFENEERIPLLEKFVLPLSEIYKNLCK